MLRQFLINIIIAFIWVFLNNSYDYHSFFMGYLVGALIILIFQRFVKKPFYLIKVWYVLRLFLIFIRELVVANIQVLILVLDPKMNINPGIIYLSTDLKTPMEVVLLANMITLTPGTLTMEIDPDNKGLYIHALKIDDEEAIKESIRKNFENNIKEITK